MSDGFDASRLRHLITIERRTESRDEFGQVTESWTCFATLRAEKITASTIEFLKGAGLEGQAAVVWRTRWRDGITITDRVLCDGVAHDIKELKEIGRRRGLDIRTVASGATRPA